MPGWRPGDPAGARQFARLGTVGLELGGQLEVTAAYETYGEARRDADGRILNAVLVLHALTADAHVAGPSGPGQPTPGWWDPLVGPGRQLDTDRYFLVCVNVLGGCQGTTGPWQSEASEPFEIFPRITIRDQVRVEELLSDHLHIERYVAVVGGSMGGMRSLEWALIHPDRVGAALVLAVGATATADQIGTQSTQIAAIQADPVRGIRTARRIAHLTYRSAQELEERFGRATQDDGRYAVASYLEHHGEKLERRFDAGSYVSLTDAMNTHDVGRGRGGAAAALASIRVPVVVGGIDTDRLYPLHLQEEIAEAIPTADGVRVVRSPYGHDGFLLEHEAVGELIGETLARSRKGWASGLARAR